jgi:hypothetical protein
MIKLTMPPFFCVMMPDIIAAPQIRLSSMKGPGGHPYTFPTPWKGVQKPNSIHQVIEKIFRIRLVLVEKMMHQYHDSLRRHIFE